MRSRKGGYEGTAAVAAFLPGMFLAQQMPIRPRLGVREKLALAGRPKY